MELSEQLRNRKCARCGHPSDWHRHDDADNTPPTDPNCKFRCIGYDCEVGGVPPKNPCACPDFLEAKWSN